MKESDILKIIVKAIEDKKGYDVKTINVKKITPFANYYILATANNERQIDAIKNSVEEALELNNLNIKHIEGKPQSGWVLIDAYQYIIDIFSKVERERIDLENHLDKIAKNNK